MRLRRTTTAALAGLLVTAPFFAAPAVAQAPNVQQLLQGLLSGNQGQDQGLREAFERGYQRGREDEARLRADRGRGERAGQDRRRPGRDEVDEFDSRDRGVDRRPHRDERPAPPPYGQQGGPYYNR